MARRKMLIALFGIVCGAALLAAWLPAAQAAERVIYMQAVEPKGGATIDKEPFPGANLPKGGGYVIKQPDAKGRWEVSGYTFLPLQVVVRKGDKVTLEIVGINGDKHSVHVENYKPDQVELKRGKIAKIQFTADKAGVFKI
ncbi:MAG: hypothetical protein AABZ64_01485, partial [Nitrospinota bacterium]